MKKQFPEFKSDSEAEKFVETANLSEFDFSELRPVKFELRRKDKSVSLRLPEELLSEVRNRADRAGMPYQRFMRLAIEKAVHDFRQK
jgi:predicted DNA binding CopG/RHH family protein